MKYIIIGKRLALEVDLKTRKFNLLEIDTPYSGGNFRIEKMTIG